MFILTNPYPNGDRQIPWDLGEEYCLPTVTTFEREEDVLPYLAERNVAFDITPQTYVIAKTPDEHWGTITQVINTTRGKPLFNITELVIYKPALVDNTQHECEHGCRPCACN